MYVSGVGRLNHKVSERLRVIKEPFAGARSAEEKRECAFLVSQKLKCRGDVLKNKKL